MPNQQDECFIDVFLSPDVSTVGPLGQVAKRIEIMKTHK